jgi:excisionase family DNA binding protein
MQGQDVYTVEEVAERLGISRSLAYQAVKEGEIPTRKIGRRIVIPRVAFEKWLSGDGNAA